MLNVIFIDLKSCFSSVSVGSSPDSFGCPSTRESEIVDQDQKQVQVQSVVVDVEEALPEVGADLAEANVEEEDEGTDLIMTFYSNVHFISDLGLRIPIASFHPNIRDDFKRAYLLKGPTQPKAIHFLSAILWPLEHNGLMIMIG